ncbi:MAG: cytochrome P450, partial [Ketobacteraceae bacterium]|nr:cytochrome P450 [Ketobacteraceae bacterium]
KFRDQLGKQYFYLYRDFSRGADVVLPSWLPLPKFRRSQKAKRHLEQMFRDLIAERRQNPLEPKDLLQELIEAKYYDDKPLPENVLTSIMLFIPWAAHETTVGAVGWTLIDLLQNPDYLLKVKQEVDEVLGKDQNYTKDTLKQLKHLDWAILESERKHPVAHMILRGVREDVEFEKYKLKQGSLLFLAPETAHNIPEVFSNPEKYDPERFSPERMEGTKTFSLIGFGGGAHRCAGVNFAKLEQKVLVAKLLQNYDIELLSKNPKPQQGIDTAWPESPTLIKYQRATSGRQDPP